MCFTTTKCEWTILVTRLENSCLLVKLHCLYVLFCSVCCQVLENVIFQPRSFNTCEKLTWMTKRMSQVYGPPKNFISNWWTLECKKLPCYHNLVSIHNVFFIQSLSVVFNFISFRSAQPACRRHFQNACEVVYWLHGRRQLEICLSVSFEHDIKVTFTCQKCAFPCVSL